MIELLELSEVLKAVERTGTEVRYYDPDCATSKAAGWYQLNATVDRLVICPRNNINHSDLLTLLGMKLCTWYKLLAVDQCKTELHTISTHHSTSKHVCSMVIPNVPITKN